ncbi:MAG: YihY/virulence factor BrkB family protein [Saprospiraceae bacterium]|nr:YihY/virulence factor BrkB family protein [Saprospiraceae bacterium]
MVKQIQAYINNLTLVETVRNWAKNKTFSGFQGVSLHAVLRFLYDEVFRNPMTMTRANAIAFSFFMSLFPAFLVLFSLIPFIITILPIKQSDILKQINDTVIEIMPNKTGETFYSLISSFLKKKRTDYFSIGFILSIYFASNGLMALMRSFEKNHAIFQRIPPFEKRIRAVGMTFMLGILLVVSTVLVILGNQIFTWLFKLLQISKLAASFFILLKWFVVVATIYIGIAAIYKFGTNLQRKLNFFSPGALTATIFSLISSVIFSFYVDNFGQYDKVYGSFVAGIILLLWLQLNAIILIVGFELNAAIAVNREAQNQMTLFEDDPDEALENLPPQ